MMTSFMATAMLPGVAGLTLLVEMSVAVRSRGFNWAFGETAVAGSCGKADEDRVPMRCWWDVQACDGDKAMGAKAAHQLPRVVSWPQ